MINLDLNKKSEAQIRLAEKLERDRIKLHEQIKKEQKKIADLQKRSKALIGDVFSRHLPDYYNFEADELTQIVDTAMEQEATKKKIDEIRQAAAGVKAKDGKENDKKGNDKNPDDRNTVTPEADTPSDGEALTDESVPADEAGDKSAEE